MPKSFRGAAARAITMSIISAVATLAPLSQASADTWPSKSIKYIVPFAPGGTADGSARILAEELSKRLGQPIVIENRPGVSGMDHRLAHGLEDRLHPCEALRRSPDHEGQARRRRARHPARDRRVEKNEAASGRLAVEAAGGRDIDGGTVDEQRAHASLGDKSARSKIDRLRLASRGQHGDDDLGTGDGGPWVWRGLGPGGDGRDPPLRR